jgi:hypothetical protein
MTFSELPPQAYVSIMQRCTVPFPRESTSSGTLMTKKKFCHTSTWPMDISCKIFRVVSSWAGLPVAVELSDDCQWYIYNG